MSDETLLEETLDVLRGKGKSPDDVRWVGSRGGAFATDWGAFAAMAAREYDSGLGVVEVVTDLVVVGDGWWLERHEYDGCEWWEYKTLPMRRTDAAAVPRLFVPGYEPAAAWDGPGQSLEREEEP